MEIKFYTKQEAANILGFHARTIERYLLSGKLKGARLGKSWRISEDDLNTFYNTVKEETAKNIEERNKGGADNGKQ